MTAVEIVRAFHELDEAGRKAALANTATGLGKDIAGNPGARAAIAQDYDAHGKHIATNELSADEKVAAMLPSHPFRSGASIPEGIKLDAAGKATEIPPDAKPVLDRQVFEPLVHEATSSASVKEIVLEDSRATRPLPVVGDKVTVKGKAGEISKVEDGVATEITFKGGAKTHTATGDVEYLYVDLAKAQADEEWQKEK